MGNFVKNYFKSTDQATKKAGLAVNRVIGVYKRNPILFLTSGGSALKILDYLDSKLFDNLATVSVLDERFSLKESENNFLQLKKTKFYSAVKKNSSKFIETVPKKNESQEKFSSRFEHSLRGWREQNKDGVILIIQGVGEDGHTSGIMPFPENQNRFKEYFEGHRWVVGYDAASKNPYPLRTTTTITFLKEQVEVSILFITGVAKKAVLKRLLRQTSEIFKMPSQVIWQMKEVMLFTDIKL